MNKSKGLGPSCGEAHNHNINARMPCTLKARVPLLVHCTSGKEHRESLVKWCYEEGELSSALVEGWRSLPQKLRFSLDLVGVLLVLDVAEQFVF